ncbi:hypothetical protein [Compostimonas suwonensis]|uniref:Transglycosylase-like protein with SLT domain n=1 Tax=Compostimonas suwonensis TaxID=1048394 RepID=A0A2M9BB71_9MICO|nr:hypothetical protein [Compostimonas suwonensis]PJJ55192.1 hypothetical protein CLV54_3328 [Compostimonas suwonensis]
MLVPVVAVAATGSLLVAGLVVHSTVTRAQSVAATTELAESTGLHSEQLSVYAGVARAHVDKRAEQTLDQANQIIAAVHDKVDATPLVTSVASLADYRSLDEATVSALSAQTEAAASSVQAAAAEADRVAAEAAAAAAAAEAARVANTPAGAKATARQMAADRYGWGDGEFSCLSQLWQKESGWSYTSMNRSSGATGIPQALPGSKMASAGPDWQTNAATQIAWGLDYIARGYGSPCGAWSHSTSVGWY